MKPTYSHICAISQNNTLGLKGDLPWHIPEDLKFFKEKTSGKALIMGRKTFKSMGKALPKRLNVIVTRSFFEDPPNKELVICYSLEEALKFCSRKDILKKYGEEIFITGGGEIYKQTLNLVNRIYLTRIHKEYEGDTFYPKLPKGMFKEVARRDCEGQPAYSFITYERN